MRWTVVARSKKDQRILTHSVRRFDSEEGARLAIPEETDRAIAHFSSHPTIAIDDDGFADDLRDILMGDRVEFVAATVGQ